LFCAASTSDSCFEDFFVPRDAMLENVIDELQQLEKALSEPVQKKAG
jgi:hypothetical protein